MPWKGEIPGRRNGALISNDTGQSTAYALWNLEERGKMFIADGEDIRAREGSRLKLRG